MHPYELLLKLGIFDTPEEVFQYLKKHKLIHPASLLIGSTGMLGFTIHPSHPIVSMPKKELLAGFPEYAYPSLAKEIALIRRIKRLGKPGILLGNVLFLPQTLRELDPMNRLIVLHELGHAQTVLRHPKLYEFYVKFPRTAGLFHEYLTHRKALKWLKRPLPKSAPWISRYPSLQALSHLGVFRRHVLPVLEYLQLKKMLKSPGTARLIRPRITSPEFKETISQIENQRIRALYE
ncbi:MAG: hypothetical protein QXI71_06920, partial [Candidatus Bathyarchaeia archaeon]